MQNVRSHFDSGIITSGHPWVLRTPKKANLLVGTLPNYPVDGLAWMSAVVETDQLSSDFTFNIKVTSTKATIRLAAGSPIGYFSPVLRNASDGFEVRLHPQGSTRLSEQVALSDFTKLRHGTLKATLGLHYRRGVDVYGSTFVEHQTTLSQPITCRAGSLKRKPTRKRSRDGAYELSMKPEVDRIIKRLS